MKDKAHADTEEATAPDDESHEVESWLREAVHAPQAARLPNRGDVIGGKYRIEEMLGRGGMGVVFRARHLVSERQVAIKWMLRPATDEQAQRRFEREARAAGRVDHPNVVVLYDIGEEGDCSYLVMELLHGESLRSRLKHGPIEAGEALDKLIPAMRGVAAAHRAGVVHRDLKPDNIFLCEEPDGGPREAKVLDFGISSIASKEPGKEPADSTLTQEGTLLGSLAYMSPEQLVNAHDVDARADVYAFGVILYEVLTGGLPFHGASYSALAVAIATARPERPSQIQPNLALGLEDVVLRAIARERDVRYPDMHGLIEALLPFCATPAPVPRSSNARRSLTAPVRSATVPSESSAGRLSGTQGVAGIPVQLSVGGRDVSADRLPRTYGARVVFALAALLLALAAWMLTSRWRDAEDSTPAPLVRTAPPPSAAPTTVPSITGQAEQPPPAPVPAAAPAVPEAAAPKTAQSTPAPKPARTRAARAKPGARESAPAKKQTEVSEDVLFSGRK